MRLTVAIQWSRVPPPPRRVLPPRQIPCYAYAQKVDGRRGRRQRLKYLDSLCTCLKDKVNPIELIRASEDRRLWHYMVANVVVDDTAP